MPIKTHPWSFHSKLGFSWEREKLRGERHHCWSCRSCSRRHHSWSHRTPQQQLPVHQSYHLRFQIQNFTSFGIISCYWYELCWPIFGFSSHFISRFYYSSSYLISIFHYFIYFYFLLGTCGCGLQFCEGRQLWIHLVGFTIYSSLSPWVLSLSKLKPNFSLNWKKLLKLMEWSFCWGMLYKGHKQAKLLLSSACSSLARQEKSKTQTWLELMTNLKIVFEPDLVEKPKSLNLTCFGLIS